MPIHVPQLQTYQGTYEFKFYEKDGDTERWYGNKGTMEPGMENWTFRESEKKNCKIQVSGGTYKFVYKLVVDGDTVKVKISVYEE